MTTAHRPTWNPAKGSSEQGGIKMMIPSHQKSQFDQPQQMKMKLRTDLNKDTQDSLDFKADLLKREQQNLEEKKKKEFSSIVASDQKQEEDSSDSDSSSDEIDNEEILRLKKRYQNNPFPQDEDYKPTTEQKEAQESEDDSSDSDSDDDDDDDDENEIKQQREEESKRKMQEKEEELQKQREADVMSRNPLLDGSKYSLQKKWYEDTVFKNQSATEPQQKQRFINDAVRSEFHKKFVKKYILS